MNANSKFIICLIAFLLLPGVTSQAFSQPKPTSDKINLINGKLWTPIFSNTNGNQFFLKERNLTGELLMEGIWYRNCEFLYDLELDQVITSIAGTDNEYENIVLNKYRLEGFAFKSANRNYHFLRGNKIDSTLRPYGYYQLFETPSLSYVIRRYKIKKIATSGIHEFDYKTVSELFLIKNKKVIGISSKRQLLLALQDKKVELKKFFRQNNIKMQAAEPLNLIPVIKYYDQLCK